MFTDHTTPILDLIEQLDAAREALLAEADRRGVSRKIARAHLLAAVHRRRSGCLPLGPWIDPPVAGLATSPMLGMTTTYTVEERLLADVADLHGENVVSYLQTAQTIGASRRDTIARDVDAILAGTFIDFVRGKLAEKSAADAAYRADRERRENEAIAAREAERARKSAERNAQALARRDSGRRADDTFEQQREINANRPPAE